MFVSLAWRIQFQKLPEVPEPNFGSLFHTTFSCEAAWIASYSRSATTARKFSIRTTCAPGMLLIEPSSTLTGVWFCDVLAPIPRGFTQRAWTIPGILTFCT